MGFNSAFKGLMETENWKFVEKERKKMSFEFNSKPSPDIPVSDYAL